MAKINRVFGQKIFSKSLVFLMVMVLCSIWTNPVSGKDSREELNQKFYNDVKGKTVAWVPVWLGVLEREWGAIMKQHFDDYGINLIVRDANFKSDVQLEAINALINQGVDVLVIQNPNVSLLTRAIKKAMKAGIYVVQVNMASNQLSDAYVGVDVPKIGRLLAQDIIKEIGGGKTSGEVAIIEGEATAAYSLDMVKAAREEFEKDKSIKVVSSQPCNWDANKANEYTTTILQQYPNIAAILGVWGPMSAGAGQAIVNKGSNAKLWVASDGQPTDCELIKQGLFYRNLSYRADIQGEAIVNAVLTLLQSNDKPGTNHYAYYSTNYWVRSEEDFGNCFKVINN